MTKILFSASTLAIATALLAASPAAAASLTSDLTSGLMATTTTTSTTSTTNTTDTGLSGTINAVVGGTSSSTSVVDAGVTGSAMISLTQSDVSADTSDSAAVTDSALVNSSADLSSYAQATVKSDANIAAADLSSNEVAVSYKEQAHLFGFIPVWVTAKATADADGTVTVSYPWYSFLMSTDSTDLTSMVQANTASTLSTSGSASASTGFSAQTQAELFDQMHTAMKAGYDAAAGTTVNATTTSSAATGY